MPEGEPQPHGLVTWMPSTPSPQVPMAAPGIATAPPQPQLPYHGGRVGQVGVLPTLVCIILPTWGLNQFIATLAEHLREGC